MNPGQGAIPADIRFNFDYSHTFSESLPLSFGLDQLGSLVTMQTDGGLVLAGEVQVDLGIGDQHAGRRRLRSWTAYSLMPAATTKSQSAARPTSATT